MIWQAWYGWLDGAAVRAPAPAAGASALLMETGDFLLLESGDHILLE